MVKIIVVLDIYKKKFELYTAKCHLTEKREWGNIFIILTCSLKKEKAACNKTILGFVNKRRGGALLCYKNRLKIGLRHDNLCRGVKVAPKRGFRSAEITK